MMKFTIVGDDITMTLDKCVSVKQLNEHEIELTNSVGFRFINNITNAFIRINYRDIIIFVEQHIFDGKTYFMANAIISRPDAGAYSEWNDSLEEAINDEITYIDNILGDKEVSK